MNDPAFIALCAFTLLVIFAAKAIRDDRRAQRHQRILNLAWWIYVETGRKTEAFSLLDPRDIEAAENERRLLVSDRVSKSRAFQSEMECPSCTLLAVHWIEDLWLGSGHRNLIRRCVGCNYGWCQE